MKNKKRFSWWSFFAFLLSFLLVGAGCLFVFLSAYAKKLPPVHELLSFRPAIVSQIVTKDQELIAEFFKEKRSVIAFDQIPSIVVQAFLAAEDENFFTHSGIQIVSMLRAMLVNFRAGHFVQGGSTITQQVVKSLLLTPEKSFDRKIKEILLAFRIERYLTKEQVLFLYLNHIYLGHGCYGVEAACEVYFGKKISQITLPEAAILAGLPQAPAKYNPFKSPKKAKERQAYVLRRLFEMQVISEDQMKQALATPVKIFFAKDVSLKTAPFVAEHLRRYLLDKYGERALYQEGLKVVTSIHPDLSKKAQKSLQEGLREVDKRLGFRGPFLKLKSEDQLLAFQKEQRKQILMENLGYQMLTANGALDLEAAFAFEKKDSEISCLSDELVSAVILSFDRQKNTAVISVGKQKAFLDLAVSAWAKKQIDENGVDQKKPFLSFSRGDVVKVRLADAQQKRFVLEQEPLVQGALLSFDLQTSGLIAMVGGYDFKKSEFNRAIQASRQMGSAFKPIIYATALENGYTPATIIVDSPLVFKDALGNAWKPSNYEERFYGDTTFRQALIKSRNIPTVKIVQNLTVPKLIAAAKRYGLNSAFPSDLSIALGSASVSLLDLAKAYAIFPRLGKKMELSFFDAILNRDNQVLEQKRVDLQPEQVVDPRIAFILTHLMNEVVRYGTGHRAIELNQTIAGKTGTTNDAMDAWFFGYTPRVLTAVWVGHDTQRTIGNSETGAKAALPIWLDFMKSAVQIYPSHEDFEVPEGIVFETIDAQTGKLAGKKTSQSISEAFIQGTEPQASSRLGLPSSSKEDFFQESF